MFPLKTHFMKKYLYYTLTLVGCWLLPIGVHTLVERYFTDSYIYDISWGIFVYLVYYYGNAIGILLASLLFQWRKELFFVPYGILSFVIFEQISYRPLRTWFVWITINISYCLLFVLLDLFKK